MSKSGIVKKERRVYCMFCGCSLRESKAVVISSHEFSCDACMFIQSGCQLGKTVHKTKTKLWK